MDFSFVLIKKDKNTKARLGVIKTPHGVIKTPAYAVVATRATVRGLDPNDLTECQTQLVLGNAYHLYLHPGLEIIDDFGGFTRFMNWEGPSITDSGGYQASFLWSKDKKNSNSGNVKVNDEGMFFSSYIDGSKHLLTPEKSISIQYILGADMIMAFDQPMGYKYTDVQNKKAWERSLKWEERSFVAWRKIEEKRESSKGQALFGIVQGLTDKSKKIKFLKFILKTGFSGIAIGDETIGSDPKITAQSLDTVSDLLPDDKPVHALGLGGGPEGIFEAVERGVDIFDNSSITRMARTGLLFIFPEDGGTKENKFRLDIKKNRYHLDKKPISKVCGCLVCKNYSRAYLHHLLFSSEILGSRLATMHDVYFINNLMHDIRSSISGGNFTLLKKHWFSPIRTQNKL